jgi:hypothetical protein
MSEKKKHRIHSQAISAIPSFSTFAKFQKDQVRSAKEAKIKIIQMSIPIQVKAKHNDHEFPWCKQAT